MTLASVEEHYHNRTTEIYYFLEGEGIARLGGVDHLVRAGSFLHIPPGVPHSFTGSARVLIVGIPAISTDDDMVFTSQPESGEARHA